jgi:nitroreductase
MTRSADHAIDPLFLERWSPRAMDGTPVTPDELARLFEAARWAPSSSNQQPWRFVYAERDTPEFQTIFELLVGANRVWCARAGALLAVCSRSVDDKGQPAATHAFDAGAAWMSLALQGSRMGLVVHAMGGFDRAQAPASLGLAPGHEVHCIVAVGHPGDPEMLPEKLREREKPSGRRPVTELVYRGRFGVPGLRSRIEDVRTDVRVGVDRQRAFEAFTREMGRWWPLADHSVGGADAVDCEVGPAVGAQVVERLGDGTTHVWGTVWRWDAPGQVTFSWHPGHAGGEYTVVTVTFEEEAPEVTRVRLTQAGWEVFGPDAHGKRERYEKDWPAVLALYRAWAERPR